ncbi:MAG: insulinase family protein [Alphaproteobacteria bacterium]|nr:insulinase family protein [Alphaproteobacteria bacterium]
MRTILCTALLAASPAWGQAVEAEEFVLDNGMKFLLYPRTEQPLNVSAGWVAHVGSVNERPGITGISHFFEHMMFKGTQTIGTNDPAQDAAFREQQEAARTKLRALQLDQNYARYLKGEIDDPWHPSHDTPEMAELRKELDRLVEAHKSVIVKDEFDQVYTQLGGSRMNAFTSNDLTFYFITVPSNKIEHWAWLESDRLADSVFREFYSERDVVHEERRKRTESTPTGVYDEQFEAMFWESSPYSWPVVGWPTDLNSYTMEQAQAYYDTYYRPNNLTGVIVGDFDAEAVKPVLVKYFGRLEAGEPPPPVVTLEMPQLAEKRMDAACECTPQVTVRHRAPPYEHADMAAFEVLANLLNGRTGRLYRSMVEGASVAAEASSGYRPLKYGGYFDIGAEVKGDATPDDLEREILAVVAKLQAEPVPERELQKVKNQVLADSYRRLEDNYSLMVQLGFYEALGDWRYLNTEGQRMQAVTAEDVQRVAKEWLVPSQRSVASYVREGGEE